MTSLQAVWFFLIYVLLTGYAILDGFDLGVGIWYRLTRRDEHRKALLNAIKPVWDGNEVWLLAGGGALFAAFPEVYATAFSGMYLALMLVLFALILRAVSIEFRGMDTCPNWRSRWDVAFALGSIVPALLFGVACGNVLRGVPLDEARQFTGTFLTLLNPYALLIGLLGFAMFATHGALYIALKTRGELAEQGRSWARTAGVVQVGLFLVACVATALGQRQLLANYEAQPLLTLLPLAALAAQAMAYVYNQRGGATCAFVASAVNIVALTGICAAALFPNMLPALGEPALSLSAANGSSSELTLKTMLILALIGMPLVLGYTIWIYRTFGGKVGEESTTY